jgi:preprotein translocase subunit SecD
MKIRWGPFNIYLAALSLALLCGCRSPEARQLSTLRIHLEVNRDISGRNKAVPIYRDKPFMVNIDTSAFLTEAQVKEAKVVDSVGGFELEVSFERRGVWLLEEYSTANRGKRFAVYSEFSKPGKEKGNIGRWLGAPVVHRPITDGVLKFTPDATREEAVRIVRGLNNLAKKMDSGFKW